MCLGHITNEIGNPWIGGADDEADRPILSASNTLGEREDEFLHGRGSERDSRQIQNKNLRTIKKLESCS